MERDDSQVITSTHGTNIAIGNPKDIDQWRALKKALDRTDENAESNMLYAFGCHGSGIAEAISNALWGLSKLLPIERQHELKAYLLPHFQAICQEMNYARAELDTRIEQAINDAKREGFEDARYRIESCLDSFDGFDPVSFGLEDL